MSDHSSGSLPTAHPRPENGTPPNIAAANPAPSTHHTATPPQTLQREGLPGSVSVLMPVYNAQSDAWRTIASFSESGLSGPVRFLVVDDGSSPPFAPPPLIEQKNAPFPPQVDVLRLAANVGIEGALAAGVDALLAEGVRYIARMDAGDIALPERLSKQRAFLDAHPEVGALGMAAQVVKRDGTPVFTLSPPTAPRTIRRVRFARSCFIHPAMMLRADAIRRAGNYRCDYPAAEDLDLFLRIMRHDECANLADVGILYEINERGISATRRRIQIGSTLRLLIRHAEPANPYFWLGVLKNLTHLVIPYALLHRIKHHFFTQSTT